MKISNWKIKRLWYLLRCVGAIMLVVAAVGVFLVRSGTCVMGGRILISLDIICFAWMFVALTGKVLRNRIAFVILFLALMSFGVYVYSDKLDNSTNKAEVDEGTKYLNPIVNTLSIFFPSRGDYNVKENFFFSYYLLHFLGYFFAAWVLFSLFGKKMIGRTLYFVTPKKRIYVFWGYSVGGKVLAKDVMTKSEFRQPVFVLPKKTEYDSEEESRIIDELMDFGAVVIHEDFGKDLSIKGERYFFMTEKQDDNVSLALRMIDRLSKKPPKLIKKTYLHVRTEIEGIDALFQAKYDNNEKLKDKVEVNIYSESDLAARLFVLSHPLLDLADREFKPVGRRLTIHPESATVSGECHVLLLGLGWSGFELLRKTVCDAQFLGDDFHFSVTVIDDDFEKNRGRYMRIFRLAKRLKIEINVNPTVFFDENGAIVGEERSGLMEDEMLGHSENAKVRPFVWKEKRNISSANGYDFYRWLDFNDNILHFDRIIVSLGNDEYNTNTAMQLHRFRLGYLSAYHAGAENRMPEKIFAYVKDYESYDFYKRENDSPIQTIGDFERVNSVDYLIDEKIDEVAKCVNYVYSMYETPILSETQISDDKSIEKEWDKNDTNIFNQNSSRSVALNVKNIVKIAGGEELFRKRVTELSFLEKYAEMEHMRWNAFHVMYGVDVWDKDEVNARNGKLRFGGTLARHICLVGFDKLDEMSQKVRSLGNVNEDYREIDRRIIRHFPVFYDIITNE